MKKLIAMIIAIVMFGFNPANALTDIGITMPTKDEVYKMVTEVNPVASPAQIEACYAAVKDGGLHTIYSSKVSIYCTKSEVLRVFAQ